MSQPPARPREGSPLRLRLPTSNPPLADRLRRPTPIPVPVSPPVTVAAGAGTGAGPDEAVVAAAAPLAAGRPDQAGRGGGDRDLRPGRDRLAPVGADRVRRHRVADAVQRIPRRALRGDGAHRGPAGPGRLRAAELDPVRTGAAQRGVRRLGPVRGRRIPLGRYAEPRHRVAAVVALLGAAGMVGAGLHQAAGAHLRDRRHVPVPAPAPAPAGRGRPRRARLRQQRVHGGVDRVAADPGGGADPGPVLEPGTGLRPGPGPGDRAARSRGRRHAARRVPGGDRVRAAHRGGVPRGASRRGAPPPVAPGRGPAGRGRGRGRRRRGAGRVAAAAVAALHVLGPGRPAVPEADRQHPRRGAADHDRPGGARHRQPVQPTDLVRPARHGRRTVLCGRCRAGAGRDGRRAGRPGPAADAPRCVVVRDRRGRLLGHGHLLRRPPAGPPAGPVVPVLRQPGRPGPQRARLPAGDPGRGRVRGAAGRAAGWAAVADRAPTRRRRAVGRAGGQRCRVLRRRPGPTCTCTGTATTAPSPSYLDSSRSGWGWSCWPGRAWPGCGSAIRDCGRGGRGPRPRSSWSSWSPARRCGG